MKRAVFLDRDGTIIKDKGYIGDIKDVEFYPYTFDCLQRLQKEFLLFIVTNQSGVAKGLISGDDVARIHEYILQRMRENEITLQEIYSCPHSNEDNCACKKPQTFFVDDAKAKYSLDIQNSYVVGDHPSDVRLAINSKSNGIYLLTGHGRRHYSELEAGVKRQIKIRRDLMSATRSILEDLENNKKQGFAANR